MEIRTEMRYADKAKTIPMPDTFNVFVGRTFIGSVYQKGDRWQWGAAFMEDSATFDDAVNCKVEQYRQFKEMSATA